MRIDIHGVGVKDVEVLMNGKKSIAQSGKVELLVTALLQYDKEAFYKNKLLRSFADLFFKRIYHKRIEQQRKALMSDTNKLRVYAKKLLGVPEADHHMFDKVVSVPK